MQADAERVVAEIEAILQAHADRAGCTLELDVRSPYSAYRVADDSAALRLATTVFGELDLPMQSWVTRGGSDANVFCKRGLDCLNLTHAVVGFHAPDERVAVADLVLMKTVLLAIIAEACTEA